MFFYKRERLDFRQNIKKSVFVRLFTYTDVIFIRNFAMNKIGFLGGGRMAQALAKGFISAGLTKAECIVASVHPSDSASLQSFQKLGAETVTKNIPVIEKSNIIFISVKPQVVPHVLSEIKSKSDEKLFISVAMGVSIKSLEQNLSPSSRIIRVMPNIPTFVQSGCSVFVRGSKATNEDAQKTQQFLQAVGTCEEVDEYLLAPITALSGSGPAYVFVMIEALADGAVRMGIPRDMAYRLASQTVLGSGQLVRDTKQHPGVLKDNVTSPAGSTAAALKHLEEAGFRGAVAGAVEAATLRVREVEKDQ